jgi:hypothetical protein
VTIEEVTGESAYFEQLKATEAIEALSRHDDTPQIDTPHARRQVSLRTFRWADLIDNPDKVKTLGDFESAYARNGGAAMSRQWDDLIIAAAEGTANTGKSGGTAVTLPASQKVAVDFNDGGSAANAGLTVGKLRQARQIFTENEAIEPEEEIHIVVRAQQVHDLLTDEEVTSGDYNTIRALVNGEINSYMGFTFHHCERITYVSTTDIASVLCYTKSGIAMGVGKDVQTRITERDDKNYSVQVWMEFTANATRLEEEKVVEIACDESP